MKRFYKIRFGKSVSHIFEDSESLAEVIENLKSNNWLISEITKISINRNPENIAKREKAISYEINSIDGWTLKEVIALDKKQIREAKSESLKLILSDKGSFNLGILEQEHTVDVPHHITIEDKDELIQFRTDAIKMYSLWSETQVVGNYCFELEALKNLENKYFNQ